MQACPFAVWLVLGQPNDDGPTGLFSSVQSLSRVWLFVTPWTAAHQASLSITNSRSLCKLTFIEFIAIQPSHLLPSPSLPAFNFSQHQGLFQWVGSSHQGPKYWRFSFSISPFNEHSGLISFRIDWLDLFISPRDSQESSPIPQFKSINSSVLSVLYSPTLTSIHDYWKNYSFD